MTVPHANHPYAGRRLRRWAGLGLLAGLIALAPTSPRTAPAHAAPATYGWDIVPSPDPYPPPHEAATFLGVAALAPTDAWAVGDGFVPCQGCTHDTTLAEHWDGAAWTIVATPSPSNGGNDLYGIAALSATDIWAVGHASGYGSLVEHWDGSAWSLVPSRNIGTEVTLRAVAARTPSDIWAVGSHDHFRLLTEHWNGSAWAIISAPQPANSNLLFNGVAALAANDAWAVSSPDPNDGGANQVVPTIEHWNGTAWSIVPNTAPLGGLLAVSAVAANDIWAVGWQGMLGYASEHALTEHWDGSSWSVVATPSTAVDLYGVSARAAHDVWAVGRDASGQPLLLHWNGLRWWIDPGPNTGLTNILYAVSADAQRDVWAVGGYSPTFTEHYH